MGCTPAPARQNEADATRSMSERIRRLKRTVNEAPPSICPERALLWTAQHRRSEAAGKPVPLRMAECLAHVLAHKTVRIYPGELLVGNTTSKRVGGLIAPELHGIITLLELHTFPGRAENPLQISKTDRRALQRLIPYWLTRTLPYRVHPTLPARARFLARALKSRDWVVNELGGIAHFAPNYDRLLQRGTEGILADARRAQAHRAQDPEAWTFDEAVRLTIDALGRFGDRYAERAETAARGEPDFVRRAELHTIARTCRRVPRYPARTFQEALQSMFLGHVAIVNEGLDITICPGRLDQILYPYYRADRDAGRLTDDDACELLACFVIKLSEMIPVLAKLPNRLFSGLPAYQTVVVGGVDPQGNDAVNELSYLLLDVVDALRMRQPNFHARLHRSAPAPYRRRIYRMLGSGANSPALYNDELIVPTLVAYGHSLQDARNYAPVGCVEPTCQGKSFASTDAVLFNTPAVLELALNEGRRFGSRWATGLKTAPAAAMQSMDAVVTAFRAQLEHRLAAMIRDLRAVERANATLKPTPLSSALLDGCIEKGCDVTRGGAIYNRSGIQSVGTGDVGDALCAIDQLVFRERRITLPTLVAQLEQNLPDPALAARLLGADKFGNDQETADRWTVHVVEEFVRCVEALGVSTRGGRYVVGLYSTTAHEYFGQLTGALPNGRRRGAPFTSGLAPANGADREGPTAVLNSMNRLDFSKCPNGINFNLKFHPHLTDPGRQERLLQTLVEIYFDRGGMQVQPNVLDATVLREAKRDPSRHPYLLVRVSGYSAYFNDLSEAMKDEIIARTANE